MVHSPYRFIAGVLACIALFTGSAQQIVPSMVWESFYRDSICRAAAVVQTADGGYMLGGNAYVTNELRGEDCILIKINSQGEVEWKKTYGGTGFDAIRSVRQTTDGGYVFAATSSSPPSGNKEAAKFGSEDAWIVKVDAVGNKQWEKSFGGTEGRFCLCNPANDGRWIYFRRDYSTPSAEDRKVGSSSSMLRVAQSGNDYLDARATTFLMVYAKCLTAPIYSAGTSLSPPSQNVNSPYTGDGLGALKVECRRRHSNGSDSLVEQAMTVSLLSKDQVTEDSFLGGASDSPPSGNKEAPHLGGHDYWLVKVDGGGRETMGSILWHNVIF